MPRSRCLRFVVVVAVALVGLSAASRGYARSRVSLLDFEGDRAQPLRWRVAREVKRAGHVVPPFKAPPRGSGVDRFLRFSNKHRIDAFISAVSFEGDDGWSFTLTLHGPDGEAVGPPLTYEAPTLGDLVQVLKSRGREDFRQALESPLGGGSALLSSESEATAEPEPAPAPRKKRRKRKKKKQREPSPLLVDLDAEPAPPAEGSADSWDADAPGGAAEGAGDDAEDPKPKANRLSFLQKPALVGDEDEDDAGAASDTSEVSDSGASGDSGDEPFVEIGVSAGVVRRTLRYVDDLYSRMRTPATTGWLYRLEVGVLPFARPLRDRVELIASYEGVFSGEVRDDAAREQFGLNHSELQGGLRLRQPVGEHEVALDLTFGQLRSGLADPEGLSRVPEFTYTLFRSTLALDLQFGDLSLRGSGGLRLPSSYGQAGEPNWFPRIDGSGVEGALGFEYVVAEGVSLAASGTMRRFVLEMNSEPEDAEQGVAEVAGGAVDLYLTAYFGFNVSL